MLAALAIIDARRTALATPPPPPPHNPDIEILKRRLSEQQIVIAQQTRLLEMSVNSDYYVPDYGDVVVDDAFEITSSELEARMSVLDGREKELVGARRAFTEAAIRLGFERVALQVCPFHFLRNRTIAMSLSR
jgi:hypothetical protein